MASLLTVTSKSAGAKLPMSDEIIAQIAAAIPGFSRDDLGVSVHYNFGGESIEATWHKGRWLWVLRHRDQGQLKGWGFSESASEAFRMALAAKSFAQQKVEPNPA